MRVRALTRRSESHCGFTLIEILIVVAIIAILASIAYPSYQEYVLKGRRAEARTALTNLMIQQERYLTQKGTYGEFSYGSTTDVGKAFKQYSGDADGPTSYKLSAAACTGASARDCIQLTAEPKLADTKAGQLTMDSLGNRDCSGTNKSLCWR